MAIDCDEGYEPFIQVTRKARKPKVCTACRELIRVGDTYSDGKGLYEGIWDHWRRCSRCETIYRHLQERFNGARLGTRNYNLQPHQTLDCGDEYRGVWEEEPPPEIAALAFALPGECLSEHPNGL